MKVEEDEDEINLKQFSYLTSITIFQTTKDEIEKLQKYLASLREKLDSITNYREEQMWRDDLMTFLDFLKKQENKEEVKKAEADKKLEKQYDKARGVKEGKKKRNRKPKNNEEKNGTGEVKEKKKRKKQEEAKNKEQSDLNELLKINEHELSLEQKL